MNACTYYGPCLCGNHFGGALGAPRSLYGPLSVPKGHLRRYPPRGGKRVLACSVETWGYIHSDLDHFLGELAVLASQKQRDKGQHPTRWLSKWRAEISIQIAVSVGKSLVAAVPPGMRPICIGERME